MIDYTPGKPDFNILRLGHIEYLVSDLARARDFYVDVVGLFETDSDADHVYLRAIEDREHHSVVLTRSPSPGIGHFSFRVSCEEDLERLAAKFKGLGLPMRWLEAGEERGQGRALRVQDPFGFPVEYYAHMDQAPWMLQQYHLHRHGCPTRLDHLNVLVPDAQAGFDWYTRELGFFCSEYTVSAPPEERVWASWLYRKATIHDIAVMTGKGPTVHHAGFSPMEPMGVIRACDALARPATPTTSSAAWPATASPTPCSSMCATPTATASSYTPATTGWWDRDQAPLRWELTTRAGKAFWGTPPPRRWYEESMSVARSSTAARSRCPTPSPAPSRPMSTDPAFTQDSRPANRHVIIPPTGLLPHRPYSPAVLIDRLLFVSATPAPTPSRAPSPTTSPEQTEQAFRNPPFRHRSRGRQHGGRGQGHRLHDRHGRGLPGHERRSSASSRPAAGAPPWAWPTWPAPA